MVIAHRGASGYAPEHTMAAYELALSQGADFIEPDLQTTLDGALICLHDLTLERTSDVQEVFPDRVQEREVRGKVVRQWAASAFTLSEIKQLDAGSWFDERFRGERIPTFGEVVELVRGRAGLYPETKVPEMYAARGFEMERMVLRELDRHGLASLGSIASTPVVIQSFSEASLKILKHDLKCQLPLALLVSEGNNCLTRNGLDRISHFASRVAPDKRLLLDDDRCVEWAHDAGLWVAAWTFRADDPGEFPSVEEEMAHFLYGLGIDELFTNNPDLFPRSPR